VPLIEGREALRWLVEREVVVVPFVVVVVVVVVIVVACMWGMVGLCGGESS